MKKLEACSENIICEWQVDQVRKNQLVQALKRSNSRCKFLNYQTVSDTASCKIVPTRREQFIDEYTTTMFSPSVMDISVKCESMKQEFFSLKPEQIRQLKRLTIGQSDSAGRK
ncbi:hypothetical protein DPMN_043815 [Dreissena polymorpha]|uniref:Uncharacterized protein n=1 Tax=Dreissena polymorpha TaxID=45954 RepID=A0A9D4D1A4_DREPO|nr:hypothetical protein DPMN_043815 [Dreissena polymorpha]